MCGGGGGTQAGGPAPTPLLNTENQIFAPLGYPNAGQAAGNAYGAISGVNGLGGMAGAGNYLASQAGGAFNQLAGAGNQYAGMFNNLGNKAAGSGQAAYNQGVATNAQFQPYVGQALQSGFDPQNALYARTLQQITDQANAQNAMSGIASTPYGAGVANQANENFNIDWQNNQLQRQATGASTAAGLAGAGNQALQGGTSALQAGQGLAGSLYGQGAGALGNLYSQGAGAAGSLLGSGVQAQQQQIADYLAYLGQNTSNSQAFTGAVNNTYAGALGGASLNNQAAQQNNANFGSTLSGLGKLAGSALPLLFY